MELRRAAGSALRSALSPLAPPRARPAGPLQYRLPRFSSPAPGSFSVRTASTSASADPSNNAPSKASRTSPQPATADRSRTSSRAVDELDAILSKKAGMPLPRRDARAFFDRTQQERRNDAFANMKFPTSAAAFTPRVEQDVGPAPFDISPALGRTIDLSTSANDLARALRTLEARCAANSVRRDLMRQRFHERPGLRRKRLKSERWRRRFKSQFQQTVSRVQELRRKGW